MSVDAAERAAVVTSIGSTVEPTHGTSVQSTVDAAFNSSNKCAHYTSDFAALITTYDGTDNATVSAAVNATVVAANIAANETTVGSTIVDSIHATFIAADCTTI